MATIPPRIKTAIDTINSVYDQSDVIRLYLNNFKTVPKEFIREKIEIHQGEDLRSTGKLFWAMNPDEYYFCIDDDLIYPPTYAEDMVNKLNEYDDKIVVSLHGKRLKEGHKKSYFRSFTMSLHCLGNVNEDTFVHVIGNGVSAFNTNNVKIDYTKFKYHYMDDIEVSIQLQKQNIPALVRAHKQNYLIYNKPKGLTLFEEYNKNDATQAEMINTIEWTLVE